MVSAQPTLWDAPAPAGPGQPVAAGERTHDARWALRSPDGMWHVRFGSEDDREWWARTSAMKSSQWVLDASSWDAAVVELCEVMGCSPPGGVGWADRRDRHSPVERGEAPAAEAPEVDVEAATAWRVGVVTFGNIRWLPKARNAGTAEEALAQTAKSEELGIGKVRAGQTADGRAVAEAFDFGRQATLRAVEIEGGRAAQRRGQTAEVGL